MSEGKINHYTICNRVCLLSSNAGNHTHHHMPRQLLLRGPHASSRTVLKSMLQDHLVHSWLPLPSSGFSAAEPETREVKEPTQAVVLASSSLLSRENSSTSRDLSSSSSLAPLSLASCPTGNWSPQLVP